MEQKIGVDFDVLAESLGMKKTASIQKIAVEGNKHLFVKAIADLFRKNDEDGFWKIETAEDGNEYFIRTEMTDPAGTVVQSSTESDWKATSDKEKKNVTLSYKNIPIKKFASSEFGFTETNTDRFCKHLIQKVSDNEFKKHVVAELSPRIKETLKVSCPEFFK